MEPFWQIFQQALPEALGGILVAGILAAIAAWVRGRHSSYLGLPSRVRFKIKYRHPEDVPPNEKDTIERAWKEIYIAQDQPVPDPRATAGEGKVIATLNRKGLPKRKAILVGLGHYTDYVRDPVDNWVFLHNNSTKKMWGRTWGVDIRSDEMDRSQLKPGTHIKLTFTLTGYGVSNEFEGSFSLGEKVLIPVGAEINLLWKEKVHVATAEIEERNSL